MNNLQPLIELIASETGQRSTDINLATQLEDIVKDSLEFLQLIHAAQDMFAEFPDSLISRISTVGDLLAAIEGRL